MPVHRLGERAGPPPDAGELAAHLEARGYALGDGGVQIHAVYGDGADAPPTGWWAEVDADRDPLADGADFAPAADPRPAARAALAVALGEIRAKAPSQRTAAERAVLALAVIERNDA